MYKKHELQWLICHKPKPNQSTKINTLSEKSLRLPICPRTTKINQKLNTKEEHIQITSTKSKMICSAINRTKMTDNIKPLIILVQRTFNIKNKIIKIN